MAFYEFSGIMHHSIGAMRAYQVFATFQWAFQGAKSFIDERRCFCRHLPLLLQNNRHLVKHQPPSLFPGTSSHICLLLLQIHERSYGPVTYVNNRCVKGQLLSILVHQTELKHHSGKGMGVECWRSGSGDF